MSRWGCASLSGEAGVYGCAAGVVDGGSGGDLYGAQSGGGLRRGLRRISVVIGRWSRGRFGGIRPGRRGIAVCLRIARRSGGGIVPSPLKIAQCSVLRARVDADLARGRTPGSIAGRLRAAAADPGLEATAGSPHGHGLTVSHEAIYSYIYALPKGELVERGVLLPSGGTRRRPRKRSGQRQGPIVGMVSIDQRPEEVAARAVPGHWEGDLIIGRAGASAAATLVERTTRFTAILALPLGRGSESVVDAVLDHTRVLPAMFAKSLTWDQGVEMARHAHLTKTTKMPVYFAHPHCPWERGTNENTNGRIRRYLPNGTDIPTHQPYLTAIAEELNEVPRKCLNWLTPREAYERLLTSEVASTP
uniref:IS30 family transposase n=1 Tax=Kineosphaera limosa TaxID=111564 RepID=UPI003570C724